jgi:phenylalanine-4-hydroxylase
MSEIKPSKQIYSNYSAEDFKVWELLYLKQLNLLKGVVSQAFLKGLDLLDFNSSKIPDFNDVNKKLKKLTSWQIKTVSNIAEPVYFFSCLSKKQFTSTCWLRNIKEIDYLEEPDMFHDVFGHIPLLSNHIYSDFFQKLGKLSLEFLDDDFKIKQLQRLYWFTIEFGLIKNQDNFDIYGAGIISSEKEIKNVYSENSIKKPFNLSEILKQDFIIDKVQKIYFFIDSFDQLLNSVDQIRNLINSKL